MKQKIFLALLSFSFIYVSNAQTKFGVTAGLNSASWKGDAVESLNNIVDATNGYIKTKSRTGFHIGAYASVPVAEGFSFEPGLLYSQKGYAMKGDLDIAVLKFLGVNAKAEVQADYLDVPLLMKAEIAPGLSVFAGPQVSFLLRNRLHLSAGVLGFSLYNQNVDMTDDFNKVDVGLSGGLAYKFSNGFKIQAGYDHGLSKVDANENFKSYNRVVKVGVGFEF